MSNISKTFSAPVFWGLVLLFCAIASYELLSHLPFIQQEMAYQAHWWNHDGFLQTLFDPDKTDYGRGRFRYVEYLTEAAYWKMAWLGLLPKTLHDYFSLALLLSIAFLLAAICRRKGLSLFSTLCILGLLLFSLPVFMGINWHYRKAKLMASLWLVLLAWLEEKGANRHWIIAVSFIGFFTDPFFTVLAPFLLLSHDVIARRFRMPAVQNLVWGYIAAFGILVLINGFIGHAINPKTVLILTSIPGKPDNFLNLGNWDLFPQILPQLLGFPNPKPFGDAFLGFLLLPLLLVAFAVLKKLPVRFTAAFLVGLPICAVVVHPSYNHTGVYDAYYGQPCFILFLLFFIDFLFVLEAQKTRWVPVLGWVATVLIVSNHLSNRDTVFNRWSRDHVENPVVMKKLQNDLQRVSFLRSELKKKASPPIDLKLDWSRYRREDPLHIFSDAGGTQDHTAVAYLLTPVLFHREIEKGSLRLVEGSQSSSHLN